MVSSDCLVCAGVPSGRMNHLTSVAVFSVVCAFLWYSCMANVVGRHAALVSIRRQQSLYGCGGCPAQGGYQQLGCCSSASTCPSGSACIRSACCTVSAGGFPSPSIGNSILPNSPCGGCPTGGGYVQTGCCSGGCSGISVCIMNACCAVQSQLQTTATTVATSNVAICPSGVATSIPCGTGQTCTTTGQVCINNFCCPLMPVGSLGAICPNGVPSVTTCTNNACPANQTCISNYCCPNTATGSTSGFCPNGQISSTPCVSGLCQTTGYTCFNNFCCPGSPTSVMCPNGAVSTTPCVNGACQNVTQTCMRNFCCDIITQTVPSTGSCPNGALSSTPCVNGICITFGTSCVNNVCC